MKIALMGASGTGKTTLAKRIAEQYGLELNPVGSRSVAAAMGLETPYAADTQGRREEFQRRLLEAKTEWELGRASYVTDRTTLDNLAYHVLHDVGSVTDEIVNAAVAHMDEYDVVFLCDVEYLWSPAQDPNRIPSRVYAELYEAVLLGLSSLHAGQDIFRITSQSDLRANYIEEDGMSEKEADEAVAHMPPREEIVFGVIDAYLEEHPEPKKVYS